MRAHQLPLTPDVCDGFGDSRLLEYPSFHFCVNLYYSI